MARDPLAAALLLGAIFDRLTLRYAIGGAVASTVLGEPRATLNYADYLQTLAQSAAGLRHRRRPGDPTAIESKEHSVGPTPAFLTAR